MNDKLRRGIKLSDDEQNWMENLDSALDKMPEYKGIVYRSVSDFGIENVDAFVRSHVVGGAKNFPSYTSTSTSVYDETCSIQYIIQSKHGKDIRKFNDSEQEILFKHDAMFWITRIDGNTIYMEEV